MRDIFVHRALWLSALLAGSLGCSSTGPDGNGGSGERWRVTGGAGLQVQGFVLALSGVQLLLDGRAVYTRSQNPTSVMVAGFNSEPLAVGDHTMTLKVVSQVGTTVPYLITGTVDMTLGLTGTETRSYRWPDRLLTLRAGDAVEFRFNVPLQAAARDHQAEP